MKINSTKFQTTTWAGKRKVSIKGDLTIFFARWILVLGSYLDLDSWFLFGSWFLNLIWILVVDSYLDLDS